MKIQSFKVTGLHGKKDIIELKFNDDLNILTGRNGAGKTTILKLMWYLISGNFDKAAAEIKFDSAELFTDVYDLRVKIDYDNKSDPLQSFLTTKSVNQFKGFESDEELSKIVLEKKNKNISWFLTQYVDSSFFMPTFRMIEGGFTTEKYDIQHDVLKEFYLDINKESDFNDIEVSFKKLSNNLSRKDHKFITSISAKDIDIFLVKKYAEIMKKVNNSQAESMTLLSKKIKAILSKIEKNIEEINPIDTKLEQLENETKTAKVPLNKLRKAISDFIPKFTISFDERIYFYDKSTNSSNDIEVVEIPDESYSIDIDIESDYEEIELIETDGHIDEPLGLLTINNLSAGEKQLLTFVAYNIFHNNTIFFIDEPELSLHVDWQSKLFSLLKDQNPTNQFIISTHSPFIYSIFPDKEIVIDSDKGCSEF